MLHEPTLSVVIPCYNEEEVITECHQRLARVLAGLGKDFELVYVNDGSNDETMQILREIQSQDERVVVVCLSRNFGHQVAVSAGLEYATGKAVAITDADLQDPPEVLLEMMALWQQGYDVVYGVRKSRSGEGRFKLWSALLFYRIINRLSDVEIPENAGDFRLIDRKAVRALLAMKERHRLLRGMSTWVGFRQGHVEYDRAPRHGGTTKYPLRKMLNLALDGIFSFSTIPLRLVSWLGVACSLFAFLLITYALVLRLFTRIWVPGWTLLFIAGTFMGGMQMLSIGVLGEYVGRIYTQAKRRPLYLVQEVLGPSNRQRELAQSVREDT